MILKVLVRSGIGLILSLFGLLGSAALAGDASMAFVITSDRLEMDDSKHEAIFLGDVQAKEQKMHLSADKMKVSYYRNDTDANSNPEKSGKPQGGIHSVRAEGRVILLQGDSRGTAERMIYKVRERTLEMLGIKKDASILHDKDRLEGKQILLTLGPDRSILKVSVQGGRQGRVSARIMPSGEDAP